MKLTRVKQIQLAFLTLFIICLSLVLYMDHSIQKRVQEKRFLSPTQYFSKAQKFYPGQIYSSEQLQQNFDQLNYRQREFGATISPGDFSLGEKSQCQPLITDNNNIFYCLFFRTTVRNQIYLLTFNEWNEILNIYQGDSLAPARFAEGEAKLFAQYLGDQPTSQKEVPLSEVPRYCLDAVLAIEDPQFLEHSGVSFRGILRAIATNLKQVRWSQGGSTITQQLVKNHFLTPEKTLIRKIKEIFISLILELRVSKDQILETYLNIIYLGQSGVFEVRGYGAASDFYFQKPLDRLNLPDCALLAAIVNSPGRYNPVRYPERTLERRTRVLEKMVEHQFISQDEFQESAEAPLPKKLNRYLADSASYYVDAVNKQLKINGIQDRSGLMIYTALDPTAQRIAENVVRSGIQKLEDNYPEIKRLKTEEKKNLQALLISSDPLSGEVTALVGGRNFASSPYNRAVESRRQVGSIFKPIVYLTALTRTEEPTYTPLTLLNNSPFKYEWERQTWEPKNYDNKFSQPVPLFYALKESLNVPTARLGLDAGLKEVIEMAKALGIQSPLKEYPALSLGAFEVAPLEILETYNTLARFGMGRPLQILKMVQNKQGEVLFKAESEEEQRTNESETAVLVGMMKETLRTGTGQSSRWRGFDNFAAGKTGTTSDNKDAWFAGFTPEHSAVVWIGFDDGTSLGLTGASGALPLWTDYMKEVTQSHTNKDFDWPKDVEEKVMSVSELLDLGVPEDKAIETRLIFKKKSNESQLDSDSKDS